MYSIRVQLIRHILGIVSLCDTHLQKINIWCSIFSSIEIVQIVTLKTILNNRYLWKITSSNCACELLSSFKCCYTFYTMCVKEYIYQIHIFFSNIYYQFELELHHRIEFWIFGACVAWVYVYERGGITTFFIALQNLRYKTEHTQNNCKLITMCTTCTYRYTYSYYKTSS